LRIVEKPWEIHHRAETQRRGLMSLLRHAVVVMAAVVIPASPVRAERPEIMFVPTDNVTQHGEAIQETANRLAASVRELRRLYPQAQLVDAEVSTGIQLSQWMSALSEWLPAFRRASGEDL